MVTDTKKKRKKRNIDQLIIYIILFRGFYFLFPNVNVSRLNQNVRLQERFRLATCWKYQII